MSLLDRLLRRRPLPAYVVREPDEHVLARAAVAGGGEVVLTSRGLWLPDGRLIGWHLVSKATWEGGALTVVAAQEAEVVAGAVVLADEPPRRMALTDPGRVPELVHKRVTASIRSRHHRELPGGGAWFVQRAVPGRGGTVLQVRPDPGTDPAAVRQVAGDVARKLIR